MIGGEYCGQGAPGQTIDPTFYNTSWSNGKSARTFGAFYYGDIFGLPMPPIASIVSETRVKISRVSGYDSSTVTWNSDSDFTSYQFRVVSSASDPVSSGVQIEHDQSPSSGGVANTNYSSTLTDAEVEAVSSGDGTKLVKLFLQNVSGWWSV